MMFRVSWFTVCLLLSRALGWLSVIGDFGFAYVDELYVLCLYDRIGYRRSHTSRRMICITMQNHTLSLLASLCKM